MSGTSYMLIAFLFVFVIMQERNNQALMQRLLHRKKKGDKKQMLTLAKSFLNQDIVVYTMNGNAVECKLLEVTENAILVQRKDSKEIINLDYIVRLREHPLDKNGKKKTVFC